MAGNCPEGAPFTNASMLGTVVPELPSEGFGAGFGLANGNEAEGGCFINWGLGAKPLFCGTW